MSDTIRPLDIQCPKCHNASVLSQIQRPNSPNAFDILFLRCTNCNKQFKLEHICNPKEAAIVDGKVEIIDEDEYYGRINSTVANTFNIGSISSQQVQVGNNNNQIVNITIQQLVEEIAKSADPEAKSLLKKLLENSTVGSLIGAGASALLGLL